MQLKDRASKWHVLMLKAFVTRWFWRPSVLLLCLLCPPSSVLFNFISFCPCMVEAMFETASKERKHPKGKKVYTAWSDSEQTMENARKSLCSVQNVIHTK